MNIVLIGPAFPWRGGIAHSTALLARHLAKHHTVRVITFKRLYPEILFPGTSQKETISTVPPVSAEQLIDSLNPLTWIRTARRVSDLRPDLVLFKYWHPFFALCFAALASHVRRKTRSRILFVCDNILPHEPFPGSRAFARIAFRYGHGFIVLSETVRKDLLSLFPRARHLLVPHPIYELFTGAMSKQKARRRLRIGESRVLLFFGLVRPYKGLDILLRALPFVLRSMPVRLLIVGEFYDKESQYRELLRTLGCSESVTVVPTYVPAEEVGVYFSACDAVVLPYRSATQSGIVQIAYQFNKPVITTNVGGLAEAVLHGSTGYVVSPEQPLELAEAILEFYRKKKEGGFVKNIRREKKRFSWGHLVRAVEELASP